MTLTRLLWLLFSLLCLHTILTNIVLPTSIPPASQSQSALPATLPSNPLFRTSPPSLYYNPSPDASLHLRSNLPCIYILCPNTQHSRPLLSLARNYSLSVLESLDRNAYIREVKCVSPMDISLFNPPIPIMGTDNANRWFIDTGVVAQYMTHLRVWRDMFHHGGGGTAIVMECVQGIGGGNGHGKGVYRVARESVERLIAGGGGGFVVTLQEYLKGVAGIDWQGGEEWLVERGAWSNLFPWDGGMHTLIERRGQGLVEIRRKKDGK